MAENDKISKKISIESVKKENEKSLGSKDRVSTCEYRKSAWSSSWWCFLEDKEDQGKDQRGCPPTGPDESYAKMRTATPLDSHWTSFKTPFVNLKKSVFLDPMPDIGLTNIFWEAFSTSADFQKTEDTIR